MTYQETLDWMFHQLPMYQRRGKVAFKNDLINTIAFSKELGSPEKTFKSIHVGGTNGKGSTSHMIASILQEAGYKVGLYTSPHLKNFTERIRINGKEISKEYVVDFIAKHTSFLEKQRLSFFEMTVGLAFDFFSQQKVDIAIIEVGLGGRLDSTNIITPEASVITNIGLDHTQFLGETLAEIAFEKAGIIKPNIPVIIGERQVPTESVFKERALQEKAPICFASDFHYEYQTDLLGNYQKKNINTAITAIKSLKNYTISENHIRKGLLHIVKNTHLLGRWQILQNSPKVICDTAHNKEGLIEVFQQLKDEKMSQLHIVLGVVEDKDLATILPLFPSNAHYYFCKPNVPRGLSEKKLQAAAFQYHLKGAIFSSVTEAYKAALFLAESSDVVFIGGSTFVVAELI